jgi:hypothetical protein
LIKQVFGQESEQIVLGSVNLVVLERSYAVPLEVVYLEDVEMPSFLISHIYRVPAVLSLGFSHGARLQ